MASKKKSSSNGANTDELLRTNQGIPVNDDNHSLKAGDRGPTLLEDFMLREKITHFDHERIPERVVHARGTAAHGYFQVYKPLGKYTRAAFLNDPGLKTPVFVRFSTVAGSRGSADLARDVRGFAVKFYTDEGNFDLVGNNIPVFFIQDAIKFPDLIHAVKPEPHNEIPQAASAHDTFWDFISLTPEAAHMIMWVMSDRAIPRSLRMMEGFGVHTFRLLNAKGEAHFVKFHWKPKLGMASVVWEEATMVNGKDPDFHRRDLWEAIESGNFPEWELGMQIIPAADEKKFDFDLLDPTKLVPEELVPVQRVGKLVLDRNPDNFFAETEQVAFCVGNIVPGLDFTNDPLMQGRLFSYLDTQLIRLGGPNFHEIPINRPKCPFANNQRDGHMRQRVDTGRTAYHPNTLGDGLPRQAKQKEGGFASYTERISAEKIRARSKSFLDHYTQATLFYRSQTPIEQHHIAEALQFELGKVETVEIRERIVAMLAQIDPSLAKQVAEGLSLTVPAKVAPPENKHVPADADPATYQSTKRKAKIDVSDALSILKNVKPGVETKKVAVLACDGADGAALAAFRKTLEGQGAIVQVIANRAGTIKTDKGETVKVDGTLDGSPSVLYDGVVVVGGKKNIVALEAAAPATRYVQEAYRHYKPIGASGEATTFVAEAIESCPEGMHADLKEDSGVILREEKVGADFAKALAIGRHWNRAGA